MPRRDIQPRRLPALVVMLIGVVVSSCAPVERVPGEVAPGQVAPLESRLDAIPGRTLLIPVRAGEGAESRVPVVLDDGSTLDGRLWRVVVEFDLGGAWLSSAGVWSAVPFDSEKGRAASRVSAESEANTAPRAAGVSALGTLMVSVDLPLKVSSRSATVGGTKVKLNILGSLSAPGTVSGREEAALIDGPRAPDSPVFARLIEPEKRSPVRRWRARLATGAAGADEFADPVIEALARQEEARWSWALRALARSDNDLARRLASYLVATVDFGGGITAPAWPGSQGDLDGLLSDLLDPTLDGARRAQRAEAFLLTRPLSTSWIIDDAGTPDAGTGRPVVVMGLANLSERAVLGAAAAGDRIGSGEPIDLAPGTSRRVFVKPAELQPDPKISGPASPAIGIAIGSWRGTLTPLGANTPATPPGLVLGPLLPDYTMETWISAASGDAAVPAAWATAAMLQRKDQTWTLFIECARATDAAPGSKEDTVRLWVGPTARPRLVLRIGESGYAHAEQVLPNRRSRADAPTDDPARTVTVAARPAKWVCEIKIPDWCIEEDGTLRLGLEREDSRGIRSAYPRPMLPWQTEPGRMAVGTGEWGK